LENHSKKTKKKFRLRDLFNRYQFLDEIRISTLAWFSCHWATWFERTYRRNFIVANAAKSYLNDPDKPAIFAIYHGRMVGLLDLKPRKKLTILISQSRDGEIIARACRGFGFEAVRGSPALGAIAGALQMISAGGNNQKLAFTVDGPRGPIYSVKEGVIRLAELTGLPIIPFVSHVRTCYWMKTWDRFMAPWWGTPIVHIVGEPIHIPKQLTEDQVENLRSSLEQKMLQLKGQAETIVSTLA
jgi:lysophospholipid acyltransferase (LPLAT)-like uncharacterized protein